MRTFITDRGAEDLPTLAGLTPEQRAQTLDDAERVYAYMRRSEGQRPGMVPEEALRRWGERNELGPDRINAAVSILEESGRILAVGTPVAEPPPEPLPDQPVPDEDGSAES